MKKIILFLFLFYANTVAAQSLYLGVSFGATDHNYRQDSLLPYSNYTLGLDVQYFLKDSSFGVDANFYYFFYGDYSNPIHYPNWLNIPELTTADYFCFNFCNKPNNFLFQIKPGLFYSHYFTQYMIQTNDFGPAISLGFDVKLSKKSYLCFEPAWLCGLQQFKIVDFSTIPGGAIGPGYSDITCYNFSVKFIHKI